MRRTDCKLQSQLYCAVTLSSRISQDSRFLLEYNQQLNVIGQLPTASSVLLMASIIIYLNKCNRYDIIIFRL